MAPALDWDLGVAQLGAASSTTASLTMAHAASVNTRICVWASNFGAETPASCADAGATLTWVRDILADDANGTTGAWFSADCPAGLSSTLTVTYSAAASVRCIAAFSFTGLATGSSGYLTGTPAFLNEFGTADWATPNITTVGEALLIAGVYADGAAATSDTATSPAFMVHDAFDSSGTTAKTITAYKILAASGTNNIAGTFGTAPGEQKYAVVGYMAAAVPAVEPSVNPDYTNFPKYILAGRSPV